MVFYLWVRYFGAIIKSCFLGVIMSTIKKKLKRHYIFNNWILFITLLSAGVWLAYVVANWQLSNSLRNYSLKTHVETRIIKAELPKYLSESYTILSSLDNRIDKLETAIINQQNLSEQQFTALYSLYSNSLTIFSIILGIFGLISAFLGILLSNKVNERYQEIKQIEKTIENKTFEVEKLKASIDALINSKNTEIFNKFIEYDNTRLINALKENPDNIGNVIAILSVRDIKGEDNWKIIRNAFLEFCSRFEENVGHLAISSYASLIFQFYPDRISSGKDTELLRVLIDKRPWTQQIGFFSNELVHLAKVFASAQNDDVVTIFIEIVVKSPGCSWCLNMDQYKGDVIKALKEPISHNDKIKVEIEKYKKFIDQQVQLSNNDPLRSKYYQNIAKGLEEALTN